MCAKTIWIIADNASQCEPECAHAMLKDSVRRPQYQVYLATLAALILERSVRIVAPTPPPSVPEALHVPIDSLAHRAPRG